MKTIQEYQSNKVEVPDLINYLFFIRDESHRQHLSTKSYAQHKALNEFYDVLVDLIDDFAETYQGEFGLCELKPTTVEFKNFTDLLEKDLVNKIKLIRENLSNSPHLQNILDEFLSLVYKTLYKLRYLS